MEGWTKPDPASGKIKIKRTTAGIKGKSAENGVDFSAFYCGVFCPLSLWILIYHAVFLKRLPSCLHGVYVIRITYTQHEYER